MNKRFFCTVPVLYILFTLNKVYFDYNKVEITFTLKLLGEMELPPPTLDIFMFLHRTKCTNKIISHLIEKLYFMVGENNKVRFQGKNKNPQRSLSQDIAFLLVKYFVPLVK